LSLPPDDVNVSFSAHKAVVDKEKPLLWIEKRYLNKDGQIIWCELSSSPVFDYKGCTIYTVAHIQDITERKKAEEIAKLSNIYNSSSIEASLDPLVTIWHNGKITDVNKATERITGYSGSELIGTDFTNYYTDIKKTEEVYQQVFREGSGVNYELEIQHRNGRITPVLSNASVYKDESGEIIGIFAAACDITARKKAEEAIQKAYENLEEKVKEHTSELEEAYKSLKKSEADLSEAQRIVSLGNWNWDIVTNELYWSDEIYRIFGSTPQEFGATYDAFLRYVYPDDIDYVEKAVKGALKGEPYNIDHRIILANGKERIVNEQGEVIFDEKKYTYSNGRNRTGYYEA